MTEDADSRDGLRSAELRRRNTLGRTATLSNRTEFASMCVSISRPRRPPGGDVCGGADRVAAETEERRGQVAREEEKIRSRAQEADRTVSAAEEERQRVRKLRPVTVELGPNTVLGARPERIAEIPVLLGAAPSGEPIPLWDGRAGMRAG